jgi:hypothetical protein
MPNIPDLDHKEFIVSYKQMYKEIRDENEKSYDSNFITKKKIDTKVFIEFRNNTSKVVGQSSEEFEMRKNADGLTRKTAEDLVN